MIEQNITGWTEFNWFMSLFVVFGMEVLRVLVLNLIDSMRYNATYRNDPFVSDKMSFAHPRCSSPIRELWFTAQGFWPIFIFLLQTPNKYERFRKSQRNKIKPLSYIKMVKTIFETVGCNGSSVFHFTFEFI